MKNNHGLELEQLKAQMASLCSFSLGENHILSLEPSFNPLIIRQENKRMKEALFSTIKYGSMPFYGIKDITDILVAAKKGRILASQECTQVSKMLQGVSGVFSYTSKFEEEMEEITDLVESLVFHKSLKEKLDQCFHEDGTILDKASSTLSDLRRELARVEQEIQKVTTQFLQKNKEHLVEQIITTRNDRFVVLVKVSEKNRFGGFIHGESASGQAIYVEPSSFVSVNNHKQTILTKEKEEIERILLEVSQEIQACSDELLNNLETLALLDALFAKAQWGKNQEATVAKIQEGKNLSIEKARHPLIPIQDAVLNTYRIETPISMLLITGANTGGKTVSLKCIGLSVLMTYCGMPICCEEAIIPLFDQVFVDIGDDQSVVQSLSTFSSHLSKLSDIVMHATENSLVLLDELGSGTDPKEGESLAIAILEELRQRKTTVVSTTHYGKLKAYGKKHEEILLASVQFDLELLKPTYRYIEGLTGQSNAFDIAQRFGLKESIIQEARKLKELDKSEEDLLIEKLEKQLSEVDSLNEKLQQAILEEEVKRVELEKEKTKFLNEKNKLKEKATHEASEIIQQAQEEAQQILIELKEVAENAKLHEVLKVKQKLDSIHVEPEVEVIHKDYQVGDFVELIQSSQVAEILSIEKSRITIDLNGKTIHTKKDKIRPTDRKKEKKKQTFAVRTSKVHEFKSECNLLGLRVDEALEMASKHLDDARFYNYPQIRLVHGDGSGALRKAIHDWLRKNKVVESFRLGMPKEGSTGVTIVTLKGGQ